MPGSGPLVVACGPARSRGRGRLRSCGQRANLILCPDESPAPDTSASTPLSAGFPADAWPRTGRWPRWQECRDRHGSWVMRSTPCRTTHACPGTASSTPRAGSASVAACLEESFRSASGSRPKASNSTRTDASRFVASAGAPPGKGHSQLGKVPLAPCRYCSVWASCSVSLRRSAGAWAIS